jgi:phage baseplate assembly protein gpV
LAVLLPEFVSPITDTVAVFVTSGTAAAPGNTVSVMSDVSAAASATVRVHVTVWPDAAQLQFIPEADTYVSPSGRVSVTVIAPFVAADPTFVTRRV